MKEYLYCKCGHPITVLHNQGSVACRKDGLRFLDTRVKDTGTHYFRCPNCTEVIERNALLELGEI